MTSGPPLTGLIEQFATIILESPYIRLVVIPALGGRIWSLEDLVRGREWIWHREDVSLAIARVGDPYDDVWAGGWEELFPNDAPGPFQGRDLPDHGEWWTMAWNVVDASSDSVSLRAESSVIKAVCSKEIHVARDEARVFVSYRIRSLESRPFDFLFKQHLPVRVTPGCRLVLPGGRVEAVNPEFSTLLPGRGPFTWPHAISDGTDVDLRVVPPRSRMSREFLYVNDLPQPWCGVDDLECNASLRMGFDVRTLPFVWLFLSYGGWRNTYTAVLEPCTNMPKDLAEAVRRGQSACLVPGAEFATSVSVSMSDCDSALR